MYYFDCIFVMGLFSVSIRQTVYRCQILNLRYGYGVQILLFPS